MRLASLRGALYLDGENQRTVPVCREDLNPTYTTGKPHNMGDWFVTRSTSEIVNAEEIYTFYPTASEREFDFINQECQALILKGGNFLNGSWLSTNITYETLKKIRIPIIYIGAGLQAPIDGKVTFSEEEIKCLKYIHDSSTSCGVRGESTKEALAEIGIDNARVIACPTLYWRCQPTLKIAKPSLDRVAWTMRDVLLNESREMQVKQFELMRSLRDYCREFTIALQGEEVPLQDYYIFDRYGARVRTIRENIDNFPKVSISHKVKLDRDTLIDKIQHKYGKFIDSSFLYWIAHHSFFSYDPAAYLDFYRSLSFIIGCRLHGNLVSLSQGIPAYFLTYDERTQEMANLLSIPSCKIRDFQFDPNILADISWEAFEAKYAYYYQEFKQFFTENNIITNLN
jgi:hypothetical protein